MTGVIREDESLRRVTAHWEGEILFVPRSPAFATGDARSNFTSEFCLPVL